MKFDRTLDDDKGMTVDYDFGHASRMKRLGVHRAAAPREGPLRRQQPKE
ncbi:hypothetical protein NUJ30_08640 [Burkholderia contaminans]|nr:MULTISPECIES: hypothetical protein [Burkholderia cepacia complex]MBD1412818.1 hypothetical protein [Burkholderia contaminans]MEC4595481.1 hypothetical protein [Burkholderia vietnamiensis]UXZ68731.1 hypothetical protein NUJ29_08645 [Burkholderia contaminans]UXZ76492.1 hypothetical protein NUJ30_08640 [Burkholderia contaminans]